MRRLFALALMILTMASATPAPAARIETGRDLSNACAEAQNWYLSPEGAMPRAARWCKQYLEGYLMVQKRIAEDDFPGNAPTESGGAGATGSRAACLPASMSYAQMAALIVRTGEWNPALMDKPAIDLASKAFAGHDGC
ncbi:MAG: Rap1a/Tai family immunity protein [Parvibaculaceae bacterium]|nr:Rap1a/Tai family immunity protein [Parvibaculaceae bacterium]